MNIFTKKHTVAYFCFMIATCMICIFFISLIRLECTQSHEEMLNKLNERIVELEIEIDCQNNEVDNEINNMTKKINEITIDVDKVREDVNKIHEENNAKNDMGKIDTEFKEAKKEPTLISLGEFSLTAYCSCEICCNEYALNRPLDENGNEIVYGAIGERLTAGVSIAVDPRVIPYGTKVVIDGKTYIAQDTGGAIKGNRIDVYHDSHEEALKFAVKNAEVFIVED